MGLEGVGELAQVIATRAHNLAQHALRGREALDGLAKEAELGALSERQALVVVLEHRDALGRNLLIQLLLGVLDGVLGVVGLVVLQVKTVVCGLGVVPMLLVAEDVIGHAAYGAHRTRQHDVHDHKHGHQRHGHHNLDGTLYHPPHLASGTYLLCH